MEKKAIEGYQLSPQQRHLWLLSHNDNKVYISLCAILIEGCLKKELLKIALESIVKKYEVFHLTFQQIEGMQVPVQIVGDSVLQWGKDEDLSHFTSKEQQEKIEALFNQLKSLDFDFQNGPLTYVSTVTLSEREFLLFIASPSVCADAITLDNLMEEIGQTYSSLTGELDENLSLDDPLQYLDICDWQNELLTNEPFNLQEICPDVNFTNITNIILPFEKHSPKIDMFKPTSLHLNVAPELVLSVTSSEKDLKLLLLCCWQSLLWRVGEENNIMVSLAYDCRSYEGLEQVYGLFAKYLPVYSQINASLQFDDLFEEVTVIQQKLSQIQEYFSWESLLPKSDQPFSFFNFEFHTLKKCVFPSVSFSMHKQYSCFDRFKINLCCISSDGALSLEFRYDSNLFEKEDIERLSCQFITILESVTTKTNALIKDLNLLGVKEKETLLGFNKTKVDFQKNVYIHSLFQEQVNLSPNETALIFEKQKISYDELNKRSNLLAHYLIDLGVKPETLVGICVERSIEMIVGILAILKAGAAYVPLDPSYPKERLTFIVEDARISILLTQEKLSNTFNQQLKILLLDKDLEYCNESDQPPSIKIFPQNLAYCIYTSGSTGKPKGVVISHSNICNYLLWMKSHYPLTKESNVLQTASLSFDVSVREIFWPLISGAKLTLPSQNATADSRHLVDICLEQGITDIRFVPPMLRLFLEEKSVKFCTSLKRVFCGGEAMPLDLKELFFSRLEQVELHNTYGPTEASVNATVWKCDPTYNRPQVPIGQPIANTELYILDKNYEMVPIGMIGELYIAGESLARGYFDRPDLTAEKFIPNHFAKNPGQRLYKSGDLARYFSDGNIDFLGRNDNQVKLKGVRIELGEIEYVLRKHQFIQDVVVLAKETDQVAAQKHNRRFSDFIKSPTNSTFTPSLGEKKLIAYIVSSLAVDWSEIKVDGESEEVLDYRKRSLRVSKETGHCTAKFDDHHIMNLNIENLSANGICLSVVPSVYGRNREVDLNISLPGIKEPLEVKGTIRWNYEGKIGVLLNSTAKQRALLEKSIDHIIEAHGLSMSSLRSFLKEQLPDHMIPSTFVLLDMLPLLPNGKVDRRALSSVDKFSTTSKENQYVEPQNELESVLVGIWQKTLKLNPIGVHDNYFSLGGDSIRIIQVAREASKYNIPILPVDILQNQTIHKLAQYVSNQTQERKEAIPLELISLPEETLSSLPNDIEDAYPLSKMQEMIIFHYQNDHQKAGVYHVQQTFHISDQFLQLEILEKALKIIVQRHPALRTVFLTENEKPLQAVKKELQFFIKQDDIRHLTQPEQIQYINNALLEDRANLFDVKNSQEALFRFRFFLLSDSEVEMLRSIHHAITDGWGKVEFLKELIDLYTQIKNHEAVYSSSNTNTYKEFIALEKEIILSKEARNFWLAHLKNYKQPVLNSRIPSKDEPPCKAEIESLSEDSLPYLQQQVIELGVSFKAIFLSAYLDLIHSVSNTDPVTVGVVSNGRSERLSNSLTALGLYWNIVPFCCYINKDKIAQIREVQQLLIEIEKYARFPLSEILEISNQKELFFATFNFVHFHNVGDISNDSDIKLTFTPRGHDKFHFPLNLAVAIRQISRQFAFRFEYDKNFFSVESVKSILSSYIKLLGS